MATTPPSNLDDYSPSSTVIAFDRPLPLLRHPLPAGSSDDPSSGPFVLAFKDAHSFAAAHKSCESKLIAQCEAGARIGCAISASSKCRVPWWKSLLGQTEDLAERERCEERETAACVDAAKASCSKFAREKYAPAFRDARIARKDGELDWREASRLMFWAAAVEAERGLGFGLIGLNRMGTWSEFKDRVDVTNCRGSELLGAVTTE